MKNGFILVVLGCLAQTLAFAGNTEVCFSKPRSAAASPLLPSSVTIESATLVMSPVNPAMLDLRGSISGVFATRFVAATQDGGYLMESTLLNEVRTDGVCARLHAESLTLLFISDVNGVVTFVHSVQASVFDTVDSCHSKGETSAFDFVATACHSLLQR